MQVTHQEISTFRKILFAEMLLDVLWSEHPEIYEPLERNVRFLIDGMTDTEIIRILQNRRPDVSVYDVAKEVLYEEAERHKRLCRDLTQDLDKFKYTAVE